MFSCADLHYMVVERLDAKIKVIGVDMDERHFRPVTVQQSDVQQRILHKKQNTALTFRHHKTLQ
jgi:hypothetical protein